MRASESPGCSAHSESMAKLSNSPMTMPARRRVVHLIDGNAAYPYLLSFLRYGTHERYEYIFGSLAGPGVLQATASKHRFRSFGLGITSRRAYPRAAVRFATWLARQRIDIVQTHLFDPCVFGIAAARLARVPVTVFTAHHVHEWEVARLGSARAAALDRFTRIHLADHVVAPSKYIGRVLADSDPGSEARFSVIPNGVDVENYAVARDLRASMRRELGLQDRTVFGAIGRISPIKNYPALLRAFANVAVAEDSAMLLVVGQGPTHELSELTYALGIGDRVRFLGWHEDVRRVLSTFDVLVHPALAETFGRAVVEAMAARVPVLCTPVGIAPDLIEHGVSGMLFAGTDDVSLAAGIEEMLLRRGQWESMAGRGQERARSVSEPRLVTAHEALYDGLVTASQRRR